MALFKKNASEIPSDAVVLSEIEAVDYQSKILKEWVPKRDTFGYNYGIWVLSASSFFSGLYINSFFRKKLKLRRYGAIATTLPISILPATFSGFTHLEFVLKDVVLQNKQNCPVCLEMRASALQAFQGCVFPTLLAPVACLSLAHRYATYNVPYITQEPLKVLQMLRNFMKPALNKFFGIFLFHALLGTVVTYFEARSVTTVHNKLVALQDKFENM